jgi:hypothetical protein
LIDRQITSLLIADSFATDRRHWPAIDLAPDTNGIETDGSIFRCVARITRLGTPPIRPHFKPNSYAHKTMREITSSARSCNRHTPPVLQMPRDPVQ